MKYRVYMKAELARVDGSPLRVYRAMVERRGEDWEPWEPWDNSLLFDSPFECEEEALKLCELYDASMSWVIVGSVDF